MQLKQKTSWMLLFFLVFFSSAALAEDSTDYYLRHTFKTNPVSLLVNEVNLSYEYRFSKKYGIEITGGYLYSTEHVITDYIVNAFDDLWINDGKYFRVGTKCFFNKEEPNLYISLMYMYKEKRHDVDALMDLSDLFYKERTYMFINEMNVIFGAQTVAHHFVIDAYCGAGIRAKRGDNYRYDYYGNNSRQPNHETIYESHWTIHLGVKVGFGFGKVRL